MKKSILAYTILCVLGGGLAGFSAKHLANPFGIFMFALGISILAFSAVKLSGLQERRRGTEK